MLADNNKNNKPIIVTLVILILFISALFILGIVKTGYIVTYLEHNSKQSELIQEQINEVIRNQEGIKIKIEILDSLWAQGIIRDRKLKDYIKETNRKIYDHSSAINAVHQEVETTNANIQLQNQLVNKQISFTQEQARQKGRPKLSILDISGKVEIAGTNWVTKYSFSIKNYGGDILGLTLRYITDSIPHLEFAVPINGFLPSMGEIKVHTDSYKLKDNYQESFLYFRDAFDNYFRQKIYYIRNDKGFNFGLGDMEIVDSKNRNKQ